MMKRLFALILVVVLVFSLATVAFAESSPTAKPTSSNTDKSETSPSTGDYVLVVFGVMMVGACGAYLASAKLRKES